MFILKSTTTSSVLTESEKRGKGMIKQYYCDDCGYEIEMDESEYDGMCPYCHEHHGFYEVTE